MTAPIEPTAAGPKHLDAPTLTDEQKAAAFAAAAHTVATGGLPQGDGGLADPNRKNAYRFDELVPTQIQHKARSVIRTFVVSLVGVLAALAAKWGLTPPADLVDTITATVWGLVTVCAQWLLNTKPVDRFLHKAVPFLATTPNK
nr:MAG TPA: hypothetical protein [Caudoviricetes sp.]